MTAFKNFLYLYSLCSTVDEKSAVLFFFAPILNRALDHYKVRTSPSLRGMVRKVFLAYRSFGALDLIVEYGGLRDSIVLYKRMKNFL